MKNRGCEFYVRGRNGQTVSSLAVSEIYPSVGQSALHSRAVSANIALAL